MKKDIDMQRHTLPYSTPYAVISAGVRHGYTILTLDIRNALNKSSFRLEYDLNATFYYDKGCNYGYGGDIYVENGNMNLRKLESACKTVKKVEKTLEKFNEKQGYVNKELTTLKIIRILSACGVEEIRVFGELSGFDNWEMVEPVKFDTKSYDYYEVIYNLIEDLNKKCLENVGHNI